MITHMSLERQKLASIELDEETAKREEERNRMPEHGLKVCRKLEVLYLFENRLTKITETMLTFSKLTRL